MPGVYTIQYPENEWIDEADRLTNSTLTQCFIAEYRGTDMCMSGGCPAAISIALGDVAFSKMAFGNSHAIYNSSSYFALSLEVYSGDADPRCIQEAEKVLGSIQVRPERGCIDRATFVADITVPDNMIIPAGIKFIKTWRIKNVGTCTWTKYYTLVAYGKSAGTEADWVALKEIVQPQQTIDLSIELPAPSIQGIARWECALNNELGDSFGIGSQPYTDMFGKPFWVQIVVGTIPTP
jgi:Ig-like domain from next to BRCA1 gene